MNGSLGASAFGAVAGDIANSTVGTIAFGALSGGNFWQGAVIGGIVAGLNHAMHKLDTPKGFKGKNWKDRDGLFVRNNDGSYNVCVKVIKILKKEGGGITKL